MSTLASTDLKHGDKEIEQLPVADTTDSSSDKISFSNAVYDSSRVDPVLAQKMVLINSAIDEIGMTPFQWKLFVFNGFGYAVDSLLIVCNAVCTTAVLILLPGHPAMCSV